MKICRTIVALSMLFGLAACAVDGRTGERTLTGAAAGAAGGAAVGILSGGIISRSITGAVAGAASGYVLDQIDKAKDH